MTEVPKVRLGELIEECDERNSDNALTLDDVRGISIEKKFIPTKAEMSGVSLTPYKIVRNHWFCYVPVTSRNGGRISLAIYNKSTPAIVSSSYSVFRSRNEEILLPEYLFLLFNRAEFDRYSRFNSWGSARETFDFSEMCRVEIPLPDIEVQRDLVAIYGGLQKIVAENEALIAQLESVCHDFVIDCKSKYPKVKLGDYIEECDERNSDLSVTLSQGISNLKYFQTPKQVAENSRSDKIVRKGQFAYNRATTRNGEKISIAYRDDEDCTVSSAYGVFRITDEGKLNPYFLMMFFKRSEFDRYARWRSEGSAHEFFTFDMMKNVEIPFPPADIQKAIVDIYCCLDSSKRIVADARELMKNLCPALIQKAAHSA